MKIVDTFYAQIWVGLRHGYSLEFSEIDDVRRICDGFVDQVRDCVTITPTEYRYTDGSEQGVIIGFINYPRFPRTNNEILTRALILARLLQKELSQERVSVVTPQKTYMIEDE